MTMLAACSSPRNPSTLAVPHNHLLGTDRNAQGGTDELDGGVNAFLWRASIDTLSFMPLSSADAQGGVILTDWYQPPGSRDERFKIACYIMDKRLRSDALRLAVFRQTRTVTPLNPDKPDGPATYGEWEDTPVAPATTSDIATRILERARQLRTENKRR
ncbi:DUF3576 domain-containing protein [Formicincola oecophyllae]|nr:DUF3576 domain-containing protein [Formicincola oecophyllae]